MSSRQLLTIIGVSLVVSMLLIPASGRAFANDPAKKIEYNPQFPPVGSIYAVNLSGSAHIQAKDVVQPISAYLELNVTNVKTEGIPDASLTLINGNVTVGDETYSLTHGTFKIIPVNMIDMKEHSEDGLKVLTVSATLTKSLPTSASDAAVDLIPGDRERTGNIQIMTQNWVIDDFTGSISRIK